MAKGYSELPNESVSADDGVDYAYRDTEGSQRATVPLLLLQHFRGNLDNWDPALIVPLRSRPCAMPLTRHTAAVDTGSGKLRGREMSPSNEPTGTQRADSLTTTHRCSCRSAWRRIRDSNS